MNQVISLLQNIRWRRIVTVFLVALTFLVSTAFNINGYQLQAQAEPVTPEATEYKVDDPASLESRAQRVKEDAEKSAKLLEKEGIEVKNRGAESTQDTGKNLFDNIREKLNLDEPIDPGTKKAAEQIKDAVTGDSD